MARYLVQHRRGSLAQWAEKNTLIPMEGEIVIELDEVNSLHKLKIGDGKHTYAELAYLQAGDEIVTQVLAEAQPRIVTVNLAQSWKQDAEGKYSQVIALEGVTKQSRLDLQPDADMLAEFKQLGLVFVTENKAGAITVYSVGNMPQKPYTMQATIIEAKCDNQGSPIVSAPIGIPVAQSDWAQTDSTKADYIKNKGLVTDSINSLDERITDLENGIITAPIQTDASVAYMKNVPENALPTAEIVKIGGMSVKKEASINLANIPDGIIQVNLSSSGTGGYAKIFSMMAPTDGLYSFSGDVNILQITGNNSYDFVIGVNDSYDSARVVYANKEDEIALGISFGNAMDIKATISQVGIYKVEQGGEIPNYVPYSGACILNAPVTEVESVGVNLYGGGDLSFVQSKLVTLENPLPTGTYVLSCVCTSTDTAYSHNSVSFIGGNGNSANVNIAMPRDTRQARIVTLLSPVSEIRFNASDSYNASAGHSATFTDIILNEGDTALPYTPYQRNTLEIPEAVQSLDGYGWGINDKVYNYIDFKKKQFVKCVEKIVLDGTEDWLVASTVSGLLRNQLIVMPSVKSGGVNIVCDQYNTVTTSDTWNDINGIAINADRIEIKDTNYATQADFKARLAENPITVHYELETPEVTNISDLLTDDNDIKVEAGGTLIFANEHKYAVPSEVDYITLKGVVR